MNAAERIQALIDNMGLNAKIFSEQCGYDRPQVIYDLLKGRTRNISASMCDKIMRAVPNLNRTWLLTGDGEMYNNAAVKSSVSADAPMRVPLLPLSAFAGPIDSYYEPGVSGAECNMIFTPNPMAEFALQISGDSMEPMFTNGSIIFIKRINEEAFIPWGHSLVLDTENGVFIKNVMPDANDESYIWAESINPRYPRMHIPKRSVLGIYRVLNVQKSFITM